MASQQEDEAARLTALVANDPQLAYLVTQMRSDSGRPAAGRQGASLVWQQIRDRAQALGVDLENFEPHVSNGQITVQPRGFIDRHGGKIAAGIGAAMTAGMAAPLIGGGVAAGAGGGATAAGTGTGATAAGIPLLSSGTMAGTMLPASAISVGAGTGAAAGGGGFLGALTGGKLGAGLKAAGTIGRIAGGAAEASAQNDLSRAGLEQNRGRLQGDLFQTQQQAQMQGGNLDLQRKQFESNEEGTRLRRALIGQLLGNTQALDINLPGVPKAQVSGGLSVNSLGQGGRDTGALMTARALQQLAQGNQFQGGQILTPPTVPEVGRTGGNKFLNVLGTLGSLAGGFGATNPGTR